jgi:Fe-S oxidoreductase
MRKTIMKEIYNLIIEKGGEEIYKCFQCGSCMGICPWREIEGIDFPVYRVAQSVKLGVIGSGERKEEVKKEIENIFRCTGCDLCLERCPHGVSVFNILRALRRIFVEHNNYPIDLKNIITSVKAKGNPLGKAPEERKKWVEEIDAPLFTSQVEYLYYPCCIYSYESRGRKVAQKVVEILKKGGVSFGMIKEGEKCCGEAIRKVGEENLFKELATHNIKLFKELGVKKIITSSPHCYFTFVKEYPEMGGEFEVYHIVEILRKLKEEGKLEKKEELKKKVVYHDSCILSRKFGMCKEPREVLVDICSEVKEVPHFSGEFTLCCGGGGGGLWLDWNREERLGNKRLEQIKEVGEVLVVSCPYCLEMFEDGIKVMEMEMEVKDLVEIVAGG